MKDQTIHIIGAGPAVLQKHHHLTFYKQLLFWIAKRWYHTRLIDKNGWSVPGSHLGHPMGQFQVPSFEKVRNHYG